MTTSFARDIAPMFSPFRANMLWRFDLTDYAAVAANASLILAHIDPSSPDFDMPPAPRPPLDAASVQLFKTWINEGCPT